MKHFHMPCINWPSLLKPAAIIFFLCLWMIIGFYSGYLNSRGGVILAGGQDFPRESIDWAYRHSTGGNFLVITCYYLNEDSWRERLSGYEWDSIILQGREDSSLEENIKKVQNAAVIILDGGNQWDFISLIKGTPLNTEINRVINKRTPIAGISAGCSLLGEHYFSAKNGTVYSEHVCLVEDFALENNFLKIPQLKDTLVDTHYTNREREGRLLTFLSRLSNNHPIKGIGVDSSTALCISKKGHRKIYGEGTVSFINLDKKLDQAGS